MTTEPELTEEEMQLDRPMDGDDVESTIEDDFVEPASMDELFGTDVGLEQRGVWLDYGAAGRIKIACAGGGNTKYTKVLAAKAMPYRRQIQQQTKRPNEKILALVRRLQVETYAETVVLGWENIKLNGEALSYSKDNCLKLLRALPRLFDDLAERANDLMTFQEEELEEDAKN